MRLFQHDVLQIHQFPKHILSHTVKKTQKSGLMKEYTIYADDIFDFKEQFNKFFEKNPTAEIQCINSPRGILKEDGDLVDSDKLIATIIYD